MGGVVFVVENPKKKYTVTRITLISNNNCIKDRQVGRLVLEKISQDLTNIPSGHNILIETSTAIRCK